MKFRTIVTAVGIGLVMFGTAACGGSSDQPSTPAPTASASVVVDDSDPIDAMIFAMRDLVYAYTDIDGDPSQAERDHVNELDAKWEEAQKQAIAYLETHPMTPAQQVAWTDIRLNSGGIRTTIRQGGSNADIAEYWESVAAAYKDFQDAAA